MRRLFRSFERARLEYLLISGQASVLYGAAAFSEDVDVWIRPTTPNAKRLLAALARCGARVHRLTPPLTARNMKVGHGFHFVVPDGPLDAYLDVMACPPRVGAFGPARRRARTMLTDWGKLPVVHPADLVELKKTRRLADYDVITNLALLRVADQRRPSKTLLKWAAANCFRPEERVALLRRLRIRATLAQCARRISKEVAILQERDRRYWSGILDELQRLRRAGALWKDDEPVASLLRK